MSTPLKQLLTALERILKSQYWVSAPKFILSLLIFLWLTASNVFATEDQIYGLDGPPHFSYLDGSAYLIKDTDLKTCTSSECNTTMTLKAGCKVPYYQSFDFARYGDWIRIKAYICSNNYFETIYADEFIPKNNIEYQVSLYVYDNSLKKS